MHSLKSIRF